MGDRSLIVLARSIVAGGAAAGLVGPLVAIGAGQAEAGMRASGPLFTVVALAMAVFVWVVIERQPRNLAVWAMVFPTTAGFTAAGLGVAVAILDGAPLPEANLVAPAEAPASVGWILLATSPFAILGFYVPLSLGLLLFPDGRLRSRASRVLAAATVIDLAVVVVAYGWWFRPSNASEVESTVGPTLPLLIVLSLAAVVDVGRRYRRSEGTTRLQFRWVLWGTGIAAVVFGVLAFVPDTAHDSLWLNLVAMVGACGWVAAYGLAVGRYRLYDIDVVISRTLVYVVLAALISATYVAVVVGLGGLVAGSDLWLSVLATAVVALAFEPVRAQLSVLANRTVYGRRATPHEVLADLMARLALAENPGALLVRLVDRLQAGTGAQRTAVWQAEGERAVPLASFPAEDPGARLASRRSADLPGSVTPVEHEGSVIGWLTVEEPPGMTVEPVDARLARDLAGSAGLVLHRLDLERALVDKADEIERSRRRLLSAHDEELRRLERELERGIERDAVALQVRLETAAEAASGHAGEPLVALLASIAEGAGGAVDQIRTLARGIYPSVLDRDGLAAAVVALTGGSGLDVRLDLDLTRRHPLSVEGAVYFCLAEALTNGAKHATGPFTVAVDDRGGVVSFTVRDDGPGFDPGSADRGSGLHNMVDRVEALGGELTIDSRPGWETIITGLIPLEPVDISEAV